MEGTGVPQPNQQNGSKLVTLSYNIRSRYSNVIKGTGNLSREEGWELFRDKAGEVIHSPNIKPLARRLVEGPYFFLDNPVAVNVEGSILKDVRDESLWLQLADTQGVYEPAQFWYGSIGSAEEKLCCSYCCLFEQEYEMEINELIRDWIMAGFLSSSSSDDDGSAGIENSRSRIMYQKGLGILKTLLHFSILQRVNNNFVRMHSYNWLRLCKIHSQFQVSFASRTVEINWESIENLSLSSGIEGFLDMHPRCPELLSLLLWRASKSATIPFAFFEHMPKLRILRLYQIVSLPPSISNLHNLRALVLRECKITMPKELDLQLPKKLVVLDVSGTLTESLPESISALHNLRELLANNCCLLKTLPDLAACDKLEVLDISGTLMESLPASLSVLHNLRKLLLKNCCLLKSVTNLANLQKLEVLDVSKTPIESLSASLSGLYNLRKLSAKNCRLLKELPDLQMLRKLEVLEISIMGIEELPEGIFKLSLLRRLSWYQCEFDSLSGIFPKKLGATIHVSDANFFCTFSKYAQALLPQCFQSFYLCVSPGVNRHEKYFIYNRIYLQAKYFPTSTNRDRWFEINGCSGPWGGIGGALTHSDLLSLYDVKSLSTLYELGIKNMKELRECWIERCHGIEIIVNGEQVQQDEKIFENLENLFISNLSNLTSICLGTFLPGSFACLSHVYLECCPNLKIVFSSTLVVEKLEKLEIKFCDKLEMIFDEKVEVECVFPSLKSLLLWELPELHSICKGVFSTPRLEKNKIRECPKLKNPPLIARNQPEIRPEEQIVVRRRWYETIAQLWRFGFNYLRKKIEKNICFRSQEGEER